MKSSAAGVPANAPETTRFDEDHQRLSARSITRLVNTRTVSAVEITRTALSRAARVNEALRAFQAIWSQDALETARRIDRAVVAGDRLPLAGVPIAVKGMRGISALQATRLIEAGCVPIGATSVPGSGTAWRTWGHTERGPTLNPWNADRSPGGSSAGSAVAVATGVVPLATASDGAGSIRIPAAWCGVLGLKPTTGRLPTGDRSGLTVAGPVAGDVGDIAMYLRVVYGLGPSTPAGHGGPLRVAWSPDLGYAEIDPRVAAIAHAAARALEHNGTIHLVECAIHLRDPAPAWLALRAPNTDPQMASRIRANNDERLRAIFDVVDLIATPTTPYSAHGHGGPGPAMNVVLTWAFNLSGHPAITIPAGLDADGTPVGLQLIARRHAEYDLLHAARGIHHIDPLRPLP